MTTSTIQYNLESIQNNINLACKKIGRRTSEATLIAVSKTKPDILIRQAYHAGQKHFGENYVQEFLEKKANLTDLDIQWHFIGHLQKRKVKEIVGKVALIHSLDSWELAQEIEKVASKRNLIQSCLVQINIGNELSKSGINLKDLSFFLEQLKSLPHVDILGLMILPPFSEDPEKTRPYFKETRELLAKINTGHPYKHLLTELSMGMSHDFPVAIEEGATFIRVGTALFGERI